MSTLEQILKETMGAATGRMLRWTFAVIFFFGLLCISTKAPDEVNPYIIYLFVGCLLISISMLFFSLFTGKSDPATASAPRPRLTQFPSEEPTNFTSVTEDKIIREPRS